MANLQDPPSELAARYPVVDQGKRYSILSFYNIILQTISNGCIVQLSKDGGKTHWDLKLSIKGRKKTSQKQKTFLRRTKMMYVILFHKKVSVSIFNEIKYRN